MQKWLNKGLLVAIITFLSNGYLLAQNLDTDLSYLSTKDSVSSTVTQASPKTQRYNPLLWFFNGSLTVYQKVISPQFSANCLYELSCSRFSREAIKEYGILKGLALSADRLARCNRISATTINPFRINQKGKVIDTPKMYK
jgi:putative membrane protein insertion efficiency factor